jgi:uncharacterized integral membrane protein
MYFSLIVTFLLLMALVVASIQNATPVQITFLAWVFEMSLTGLIFYASLLGVAIVAVLTLPKLVRQALRNRTFRRETASLKERLGQMEKHADSKGPGNL